MYKLDQKADLIIKKCLEITSIDMYRIFSELADCDFVNIHGPEHHIADGASVLVAYYNSGGELDLREALEELVVQGVRIPAGICGSWGVCGSAASVGAALAIIDKTEPLKDTPTWSNHMECTSSILLEISKIGNPRCCKRSAAIALKHAAKYLIDNYNSKILWHDPECVYHERNEQCIGERCSFYSKRKIKVAFVCNHNSCRSQIAEALCRHFCSDIFECYSAGTNIKNKINEEAIRLMKELYNIDMEQKQYPKMISDIPKADLIISMGCDVACPLPYSKFHFDWGLSDPTDEGEENFISIIKQIEKNVMKLKNI